MKQGEPKANCSIFHRSVEAGSRPVISPRPRGQKAWTIPHRQVRRFVPPNERGSSRESGTYFSGRRTVAGSIVLRFNPGGRGNHPARTKGPDGEQEPHLQWPPYGSLYGSRVKNRRQRRPRRRGGDG
ncbi:unnamed protein product [Gadus morhua 'NCC']